MTSPISKRIGKNLVAGFSAMTLALGTVTTGYAVTTPAVTNFFAQGLKGQLLDLWVPGGNSSSLAVLDNFKITGGASGVYSAIFETQELAPSASAVDLAAQMDSIAQQYSAAASQINATYGLNLDFQATDFTAWLASASGVPASAVAAVQDWFTSYGGAVSAVMAAYSQNSFMPQWVPASATTSTFPDYVLTDSGWVNLLTQPPKTIVDNGNGTVTVTELKKGTYTMMVSENVLDGVAIMDPNSGGTIPGAYYPAGSRQFSGTGGVYSKDSYLLWGGSQPNNPWIVTNLQGSPLASLPSIGTDSFCMSSTVFSPVSGTVATGADNYEAFWAWDCTANGIATRSTAPDFTVRLSAKDTGNPAYPVEIINSNTSSNGSWLNNKIIGVENGVARMGRFNPVGTPINDGLFFRNPIAINAEFLTAASAIYGMSSVPDSLLPASSVVYTPTNPPQAVPLHIAPGWNLLGNSNNVPFDVVSNFGDSNKVTTVWKWNSVSSKWAFYSPTFADGGAAYAAGKGYEFLTAIYGGEGFWVNSKTSFTSLVPSGTALTTSDFQDRFTGLNPLPSGWSLISVAGNPTPAAFNNGLSITPPAAGEIAENLTTLWAWDNTVGRWYFYAPNLDKAGTLASYIATKKYLSFTGGALTPSTGFWVNRPASAGAPGYIWPTVETTTPTTPPSTVAASGIQATMTAFETLYASAIPNTADLGAMFDATFLMDGMNKSDILLQFASGVNGPTVGMIFSNIALVSPLDLGAQPNDASHQWFTFDVTGSGGGKQEPWLAVKDSTGNWLLAGNQRWFGVYVDAENNKYVPSLSQPTSGVTYHSSLNVGVNQNNVSSLARFSKILVTGPGLIASSGGGIPVYLNGGQRWVPQCGVGYQDNCYDLTQVAVGAQYTFTAYVQSGSISVPAQSYVSVLSALPLPSTSLATASFPDVTAVSSVSGNWAPGSSVTVDWTLPAGLTGNWIDINAWGGTAGNLFKIGQNMTGATPATFVVPSYTGTISGISVWVSAVDANGNRMNTSVNLDPPVAATPTAPELGLHTATGVYSFAPATGVLSFNLTHSDFICDGIPATAGTMAVTLLDVTSMTLEGTDVWTRLAGTAGDIAGTWSFTDSVTGNSFSLNLDSVGNMSLGGNIVTCPTGSTVTAPSALSNYLAEGSSYGIFPAVGDWPAGFDTLTATPTAIAGSYSHQLNYVTFANNTWSAPVTPRIWVGPAAGWVVGGGAQADFTVNADGTITATDLAGNVMNFTLTETDLSGTPITNCPSGSCGAYPTGSKRYSSNAANFTNDRYKAHIDTRVTDMNNVQLTTLPTLGSTFCTDDWGIFRPVSVASVGADGINNNNYEVIPFPNGEKCNAASIGTYSSLPAAGTVLLQELAATISNPNVIYSSNSTVGKLNNLMVAVVDVKAVDGNIKRAGTSYIFMGGYLNSVAANAELAANGLPLLNAIQTIQMGGAIQGAALNLSGAVTTMAMSGVAPKGPKAVTTDGVNLYIADTLYHTINKVVIATGQSSILAGSSGFTGNIDGAGAAARFNYPEDITTDGSNLYVSDRTNCTIRKIVISTGVVSTLAGSGSCGNADGTGVGASFYYPMGITTDGTNVFVADGNHKIRQIVIATGVVTSLAGGANNIPGCSPNPCGSADGVGAAAGFTSPDGLTTDGINVYVVDAGNHKIRQIEIATGTVSTIAGSTTFIVPSGITTDGTNLYLVDKGDYRIKKIVISSGLVSALAGSGSFVVTDGTGTAASFGNPYRITSDGSKLYVVDLPSIRIIQ